MARNINPVCRLCRREGMKLYLKGERCYTPKCSVEKRTYAPGMHGKKAAFKRKESDYGLQLREKQKARRIYGVHERQFRRYFATARQSKGMTGVTLLQILERRLDNVIYRLGLADSRPQARQLVRHGHFLLNGHNHNVPSYLVQVGDVVEVRQASRGNRYFRNRVELLGERPTPDWLQFDGAALRGSVLAAPQRQNVDIPLAEQLIVEFYSR